MRFRRSMALTLLGAALGLSAPAALGAPALPAGGPAVIVAGEGSSQARNRGGSATEFSIRLPKGASCPGDSAHGGYRVQSFLVPVQDDPAALRYKSVGPDGDGFSLYDTDTASYGPAQTANEESNGGPGTIVNIPTFNFAVFPPGYIPPGRYHIGIACSLSNATVSYWSTDIFITRAADDRPAGLRWSVSSPSAAHASRGRSAAAAAVLVVPLVLVGAVALSRRSRRSARAN